MHYCHTNSRPRHEFLHSHLCASPESWLSSGYSLRFLRVAETRKSYLRKSRRGSMIPVRALGLAAIVLNPLRYESHPVHSSKASRRTRPLTTASARDSGLEPIKAEVTRCQLGSLLLAHRQNRMQCSRAATASDSVSSRSPYSAASFVARRLERCRLFLRSSVGSERIVSSSLSTPR